MPSDNINLTLSLTVPRTAQGVAFSILSEGLQTAIADLSDLVSGNIAVFGDDFAEDAESTGDVHIVETTGLDARTLGRLAEVNMAAAAALARNPFGRRGEDLA
jgi:hypothetical protein